jgi:FlaA1/EpsC-like NDP-sugar epimerase
MKVFITGITGTLGTALAELHLARGDEVCGVARSEAKVVEWRAAHPACTVLPAAAGTVGQPHGEARDLLRDCVLAYHLAALKHVDVCEQTPYEAMQNNAHLTQVVAAACRDLDVGLVFASTDKACLPEGVYGATKLIGERAVLRYGGAAVRLGNLIGSSGSVFQRWAAQAARGEPITVTDPKMTRYFIPVRAAAEFMADRAIPGRVVAPVMRAAVMGEVATRASTRGPRASEVRVTGPRPGETTHQWLVAPGECITACRERIVLGEGVPTAAGLCSGWATAWDPDHLLAHAGAY